MDDSTIQGLLQVARFHQRHERYYAMEGLEVAARMRRDANALKALADRWADPGARRRSARSEDPKLHAAGSEDLNAEAAIASGGILFMEGENEPEEITALKKKLDDFARQHLALGSWLDDMMDRAWAREAALLRPETALAAYRRHLVVTRTSLTARKLSIAGRLAAAAQTALCSQDFAPAAIRADLTQAADVVRTAAWLLDASTAVLAEQAADIGFSDADWTAYIEELEALPKTTSTSEGRRPPAASADGRPAPAPKA